MSAAAVRCTRSVIIKIMTAQNTVTEIIVPNLIPPQEKNLDFHRINLYLNAKLHE